MSGDTKTAVGKLDDKQAIYVVQRLSQSLFSKVPAPSFDEMLLVVDRAVAAAGFEKIAQQAQLNIKLKTSTLSPGDGGNTARAVLYAWADVPELEPAVRDAMTRYSTPKQDLGVLSVPVAIGLTYALLAMDLDVNLGFINIKKKGLTGDQQVSTIKSTIQPVVNAIRKAVF